MTSLWSHSPEGFDLVELRKRLFAMVEASAGDTVAVPKADMIEAVCGLPARHRPERTFAEIAERTRPCFCTGACHPPPEGVGRCGATPRVGDELLRAIENAVVNLDRGVRVSGAERALIDAYLALKPEEVAL